VVSVRSFVAGFVACALLAGATAVAADLITGADVRNSSLTGRDVRNKSLTTADFRGSVRGPRGARGPLGPRGLTGATGVTGPGTTAMSGRITNPGGQVVCTIGAPTGLTETPTCTQEGLDGAAGLIPAGRSLRNLIVETDAPLPNGGSFSVEGPGQVFISCDIPAGETGCQAADGTSLTTGGRVIVELVQELGGGVVPGVSFFYELAPAP